MTPKQALRQHVVDMHRRPPGALSRYTMAELQRFHREQHHRYGQLGGITAIDDPTCPAGTP